MIWQLYDVNEEAARNLLQDLQRTTRQSSQASKPLREEGVDVDLTMSVRVEERTTRSIAKERPFHSAN